MSRKHRTTREYDTYTDHDYTDREYTDRESVREKRKKRTERTERTEHSRRGRRLTRDYDMERERTEYMKRYLSKRRKKGHTKKK